MTARLWLPQVYLKWLKNSNMLPWNIFGCSPLPPTHLRQPFWEPHTHSHTVPCLSKLENCQHVCTSQTRTHILVINISLFPSIPPYFIPLSAPSVFLLPRLPSLLIFVIRTIFTFFGQIEFLRLCLSPSLPYSIHYAVVLGCLILPLIYLKDSSGSTDLEMNK